MAGGVLPGVKHLRTEDAPRGSATPQCKNPKLSYFDGPIIQTPVIVPGFWSTDVNPELVANMPQFFADVTQSPYWSWLWEYNSLGLAGGTGQVILPGSATAGVTLVPSKCKAGTGTCTLQDTDIQNELSAQINAGKLPAPVLDCTGNVETVYMIEFPPLITVTGADVGTSCVNNGFCAYHNTGTYGASNTPPRLRRADGPVLAPERLLDGLRRQRDEPRELDRHRVARARRGGHRPGHRPRHVEQLRQPRGVGRQQLRRDRRHLRRRQRGRHVHRLGPVVDRPGALEQQAGKVHEHGTRQDLSGQRQLLARCRTAVPR